MAEDREKRRRGRRRGRDEGDSPSRPDEETTSRSEEEREEPAHRPADSAGGIAGVSGTGPQMPAELAGGEESGREARRRRRREEKESSGGSGSPMDFWRGGAARSRRERAAPTRRGPRGLWQRITGLYFPPWVPVVAVIIVVFGILGFLFVAREATGAPRTGRDHWHAAYQYIVCGNRQPNAPFWSAGVHTHDDGIVHIHPHSPHEEGAGARLVKWFEYGGGELTNSSVRLPGQRTTYNNGDECPDGQEGVVQVFVTHAETGETELLGSVNRYIAHDGDRIRIVFGPPEELIQEEDRVVIPEDQAVRTIDLEITDDGGGEETTRFEPSTITIDQGQTVRLVFTNTGEISHGIRVAGPDREFGTADDFVSRPDIIQPDETGIVVVRFDIPGTFPMHDSTVTTAVGTIEVREVDQAEPTPAPLEEVDVELEVRVTDEGFQPSQISIGAGQTFRITLVNETAFIANMRIAGPDGRFRTEDDLFGLDDVLGGEEIHLVGEFDSAGTFQFRNDFRPTDMLGTVQVE